MKLIPILFSTPMVIAVNSGNKDVTRRTRGLEVINGEGIFHPENFHYHPVGSSNCNELIERNSLKLSEDHHLFTYQATDDVTIIKCPYGKPGDVLWVRETWAPMLRGAENESGYVELIKYAADGVEAEWKHPKDFHEWHNRPSIHMPYSACRTWLEVVSVRPERLKDITDEDAIREGAMTIGLYPGYNMSPKQHFFGLWVNINGPESDEKNPWVWRIEFKRTSKPEGNP